MGAGAFRCGTVHRMARFWLSDLHLRHRNIGGYEPGRQMAARSSRVEDLDAMLIDRWCAVVGTDDEVWLLGDGAMGPIDDSLPLLGGLPGRIILVPGNHDRCWHGHRNAEVWRQLYLDAGVDTIVDGPTGVDIAGWRVVVSHLPYVGDSGDEDRYVEFRPVDRGRWLIHGHVHSRWRQRHRMINVGVDAWDFSPVPEATLAAMIAAGPGDLEPLPVSV